MKVHTGSAIRAFFATVKSIGHVLPAELRRPHFPGNVASIYRELPGKSTEARKKLSSKQSLRPLTSSVERLWSGNRREILERLPMWNLVQIEDRSLFGRPKPVTG